MLDALDRLYDGKITVVDLNALILATSRAVHEGELTREFARAASALREILRRGASPEDAKLQALDVTDELRRALAVLGLP